MCTGCSSCWDMCPLAGLRVERLESIWNRQLPSNGDASLGSVRAAYEARARQPVPTAQDGGVVTAVLAALLEEGYVQGALVTHPDGPTGGRSVLATTPQQVRDGAGTVYSQGFPLAQIARELPPGIEEIALVGTPCQVAGLRALQMFPWRTRRAPAQRVKLSIALFCSRSFDAQRLAIALARRGVNLARVAKLDIRDGWFRASDADGATLLELRVRELRDATLRGCAACADFAGVFGDLAVGNLGSRRGFTTVLVRTDRGAEAWQHASSVLDSGTLDELPGVLLQATRNRTRAHHALRRAVGAELPLWVDYGEHLAAYAGTEAAPVTPPPHRSHHYTVAC
jgi:coenzyme F420 hydrogenase subunit beta